MTPRLIAAQVAGSVLGVFYSFRTNISGTKYCNTHWCYDKYSDRIVWTIFETNFKTNVSSTAAEQLWHDSRDLLDSVLGSQALDQDRTLQQDFFVVGSFLTGKEKKNMISCFLKPKVEQGEHPVHSGRGKNDEMQTTSAALSLCGEMMHLPSLQLSTLLCFLSQQPCPSICLRKKKILLIFLFFKNFF